MAEKFWRFRSAAKSEAELLLYGPISSASWFGDEATPRQFADELAGLGEVERITVRINSPGGDPFAAQAIGSLLEQHPAQTVARIDGLCASAATVVACHCGRVQAAANSTYMVHPVRIALQEEADAERLRECLAALGTVRENIVALYARKTGRGPEEVAAWMDKTSWWTAAQAKENGFVDELLDERAKVVVENRSGVLFINRASMGIPFVQAPPFVRNRLTAPAADGVADSAREQIGPTTQYKEEIGMEQEIRTTDELRGAYPALIGQIEQAAEQRAEKAERQRIRDIEEMTLPGSEEIANAAKFETPLSAADYAVALIRNARTKGAAYLADAAGDAGSSGAQKVENAPPANGGADEFMNALRGATGGADGEQKQA